MEDSIVSLAEVAVQSVELFPSVAVHLTDVRPLTNREPERAQMVALAMAPRTAQPSAISLMQLPKGACVHPAADWSLSIGRRFVAEQVNPNSRDVNPSRMRMSLRGSNSVAIDTPTLLLARFGAGTWGHWLAELLPKAVVCEHLFPGRFMYAMPARVLRPEAGILRERILESLDAYGVTQDRLLSMEVNTSYQFSRLSAVTPVFSDYTMHPDVLSLMNSKVALDLREHREKVALFRKDNDRRQIANGEQVSDILRSRRFEIIDIALYPFLAQIAVFRSSRTVFSVLGSGLTGLIYSPDDVTVIAATPDNFMDRFFSGILQQKRHSRYVEIEGPIAGENAPLRRDSAFTVDLKILERMLDRLKETRSFHVEGSAVRFGKSVTDISKHSGPGYLEFMAAASVQMSARRYLEIGTSKGESLRHFVCDEAVCIDPSFEITGNLMPGRRRLHVFRITSDEFFAEYDARAFLPGGIDVAFLDGLHHFEALLRDFFNVECCCHSRSLIFLHDCLPTNLRMAERMPRVDVTEDVATRHSWTGDVWRVLLALKKYRPEMRVVALDCGPTGLIACSGLNPLSSVLRQNYEQIVSEFSSVTLEQYGFWRLWSLHPYLSARAILDEPESMSSVFLE